MKGSYFDGRTLRVGEDPPIAMMEHHDNNNTLGAGTATTNRDERAVAPPPAMDNEQAIAMYERDLKRFGLHPSSPTAGATSSLSNHDNSIGKPPRPESGYAVHGNNKTQPLQWTISRRNSAKPSPPYQSTNVEADVDVVQSKRSSGNLPNNNHKASTTHGGNSNNNKKKYALAEHIVLKSMSKSFDSISKSYDELLERHYLKDTLPDTTITTKNSKNNTCGCCDWIGILHSLGYRCGDIVNQDRPVEDITGIDYTLDNNVAVTNNLSRCQGGKRKSNDDDHHDAYTNPAASTSGTNPHKQQNGIEGIIKNNNSSETRNLSQRRMPDLPPENSVSRDQNNTYINKDMTRDRLRAISRHHPKNATIIMDCNSNHKPNVQYNTSGRCNNSGNVDNVLVTPEQRNDDPIQLTRQGTDSLLNELRQSVV